MAENFEKKNTVKGEGLNNPGFRSWNLLVNNMIAYLEGCEGVCEF